MWHGKSTTSYGLKHVLHCTAVTRCLTVWPGRPRGRLRTKGFRSLPVERFYDNYLDEGSQVLINSFTSSSLYPVHLKNPEWTVEPP